MKNLLVLAFLAFFVYVKVPAGLSRTYTDVKHVTFLPDGVTIQLTLKDDKKVYVPAFFTIIEER